MRESCGSASWRPQARHSPIDGEARGGDAARDVRSPELAQRLQRDGVDPVGNTPEQFAALIATRDRSVARARGRLKLPRSAVDPERSPVFQRQSRRMATEIAHACSRAFALLMRLPGDRHATSSHRPIPITRTPKFQTARRAPATATSTCSVRSRNSRLRPTARIIRATRRRRPTWRCRTRWGCAVAVIVSAGAYGRTHGVMADALARFPDRYRGIALSAGGCRRIGVRAADEVRRARYADDVVAPRREPRPAALREPRSARPRIRLARAVLSARHRHHRVQGPAAGFAQPDRARPFRQRSGGRRRRPAGHSRPCWRCSTPARCGSLSGPMRCGSGRFSLRPGDAARPRAGRAPCPSASCGAPTGRTSTWTAARWSTTATWSTSSPNGSTTRRAKQILVDNPCTLYGFPAAV